MAISKNQMINARKRAKEIKSHVPRAVSAAYNTDNNLLVIELSSSAFVGFPLRNLQGLGDARPGDLDVIEISPSGYGIHVPALDADFYLPALLEGVFGTRQWMADRGRRGGQSVSAAKKTAAQTNGRLGGRPRKINGDAQTA
jgi:hypothetical protein